MLYFTPFLDPIKYVLLLNRMLLLHQIGLLLLQAQNLPFQPLVSFLFLVDVH